MFHSFNHKVFFEGDYDLMTKEQDGVQTPEEIAFEEGVQYQLNADAEHREQTIDQLIDAGLDPEEVEALFDPAPRRGKGRRGGKRKCSAKQWAKMPQICRGTKGAKVRTARHPVMVYDPAPRGGYRAAAGRYYKKKGGAKGLIAGLKPMVLPIAILGTVYQKYTERATALKAAGAQIGTPPHLVDGVLDAFMYDLKNRPTTSMMDRLKAKSGEIVTPAIIGMGLKYGAKKVKLHPKVNQVASIGGDAFIGAAIGKVISTILDPPNPITNAPPRREILIERPPAPAASVDTYVPYGW